MHSGKVRFILIILLILSRSHGFSQAEPTSALAEELPSIITTNPTDSAVQFKQRMRLVAASEATLYAVSMGGLYSMWYSNYPQSHFHFFDDNSEWLQMDKAGHFVTAYYVSRLTGYTADWAGMSHRHAVLYGAITGFAYMTTIEILDGFSSEWGASVGDLIANTSGAMLYAGQELLWNQQRITLKYSWHPSDYAQYRPDLLGENRWQQMVKDYNGITLWASFNLHSFGIAPTWMPKWLNVAVAYGAEGMTGALSNSLINNDKTVPEFERYRQFYLSLDVDLTKIPTRKKWVKLMLNAIGFIKIPAPAIEYNSRGKLIFHPVYF